VSIAAYRIYTVVEGVLEEKGPWPRRLHPGEMVGLFATLPQRGDRPEWSVDVNIGVGQSMRRVRVPCQPFLTESEYRSSTEQPFWVGRLACFEDAARTLVLNSLWLFRDDLYVTDHPARSSEMDEAAIKIKALHFQEAETFRRLREQVANFEAVERNVKNPPVRRPIPDDVKLLVWSRDGGVCVRCGANQDLHFDHVIPIARGGSDDPENLQLLCRTCNLAKSDRIV
jgi:hypothetical protein